MISDKVIVDSHGRGMEEALAAAEWLVVDAPEKEKLRVKVSVS